ncbi:MAG: PEGA domain-containing protein [Magnetococcales bacterium]|nr:PEGA domain-containing protein [Magnetococcales bacterium]
MFPDFPPRLRSFVLPLTALLVAVIALCGIFLFRSGEMADPAGVGPGLTGGLAVTTLPDAAEIHVDDRPLGKAPLTLDGVPAGRVRVRASLPGYQPLEKIVRIHENRVSELHLALDRLAVTPEQTGDAHPGGSDSPRFHLTIITVPEEAEVSLLTYPEPYRRGMELPPGRYPVKVSHPGFREEIGYIDIVDRDWGGKVVLLASGEESSTPPSTKGVPTPTKDSPEPATPPEGSDIAAKTEDAPSPALSKAEESVSGPPSSPDSAAPSDGREAMPSEPFAAGATPSLDLPPPGPVAAPLPMEESPGPASPQESASSPEESKPAPRATDSAKVASAANTAKVTPAGDATKVAPDDDAAKAPRETGGKTADQSSVAATWAAISKAALPGTESSEEEEGSAGHPPEQAADGNNATEAEGSERAGGAVQPGEEVEQPEISRWLAEGYGWLQSPRTRTSPNPESGEKAREMFRRVLAVDPVNSAALRGLKLAHERYMVYVALFREVGRLDAFMEGVRKLGIPVFLQQVDLAGQPATRVTAGLFESPAEAVAARDRMASGLHITDMLIRRYEN